MIGEVQGRVEGFVADFHQRWERAGKAPADMSLAPGQAEVWQGELAQLVAAHCLPGTPMGQEGVLSSHPAHSPASESITEVNGDGDRAMVRSVVVDGSQHTYYEYRLELRDGDWRIGQILAFLDPPGTRLVDDAEAERLLTAPDAEGPLESIDPDLDLDIPSLFAAGREVTPFDTPTALSVHRLGEITCPSGILTVRDFGYGAYDLEPLARRIQPGIYPVDVAAIPGMNVALRLRLSDAPATSWHPAKRTNGTHIIGVDAGNVAILDLANLVRCEAQYVEELFLQQAEGLLAVPGTTFSLLGDITDSATVMSGYGDGAYPCYWGAAADGALVALVVDFLVLTAGKESTVTVPWQAGEVDAAELAGDEVDIVEHEGGYTVRHRGRHVRKIRALDPDGAVLMDGDQLGLAVAGDVRSQTWYTDAPPPPGSLLELTVERGYRHV